MMKKISVLSLLFSFWLYGMEKSGNEIRNDTAFSYEVCKNICCCNWNKLLCDPWRDVLSCLCGRCLNLQCNMQKSIHDDIK